MPRTVTWPQTYSAECRFWKVCDNALKSVRSPLRLSPTSSVLSRPQQRLDAVIDIQIANVRVRLPHAHKDNRLARRVDERERRSNLIIDRVKLCEHDAVDQPRRARRRVFGERLVEAAHLCGLWRVVCGARARARWGEAR